MFFSELRSDGCQKGVEVHEAFGEEDALSFRRAERFLPDGRVGVGVRTRAAVMSRKVCMSAVRKVCIFPGSRLLSVVWVGFAASLQEMNEMRESAMLSIEWIFAFHASSAPGIDES